MLQSDLMVLLQRYRLRPDKKLGQHYLLDESVLAATLEAAELRSGELVVEIGAGPGVLTRALAEAGAEVLAVEFDRDFTYLLQQEFHNWRNVHVLGDDALRLDFSTLQKDGVPYKKVVANIPYQITNPLVRKIIEPKSAITVAVLLVQKEVADRFLAPAGSSNRGILTIMIEYYGSIKRIVDVSPKAFWPAPKVDSSVIRIDRSVVAARALDTVMEEQAFFWFVRQGFSGKRKVLPNSLSGGLQLPKTETMILVDEAGLDQANRAEDLTLAQWLKLFARYRSHYDSAKQEQP